MPKKYSREEIITKVQDSLKNPATLYNCGFVNYTGSVSGVYYSEIIAEEILKNLNHLEQIEPKTRQSSYKIESHRKLAKDSRPENSNQDEKWLAKSMYGKSYTGIGKIIDFQVPLKDIKDDKLGEIDLLAHNKDTNEVYILELKKPQSPETLLRCILEVYTYSKIVDQNRLLKDFNLEGNNIRKAVVIFEDSQANRDYKSEHHPLVRGLAQKLDVGVLVFS